MTTDLIPLSDIEKMAQHFVTSKLFGVKTAAEAVSLMLLSQAEGMHPARAVQLYHIIQGRPAMKAEAMLARFQAAGGTVAWQPSSDTEATGTFSHPQGGSLKVSWSLERAKKVGLTAKDNWQKYPAAMLRARVISEAIRAVYPGCILGIYSTEETEEMVSVPVVEITGKGVDALGQKVKALASTQEVTVDVAKPEAPAPISVDRAKELVNAMKAAGIHGSKDTMRFVTDNLEGKVVAKLTELTEIEVSDLLMKLSQQAQGEQVDIPF